MELIYQPVRKISLMIGLLTQKQCGSHWHIGEWKDCSAYQCKGHYLCHWTEHLSFDTHQCDDWKINDQDDDLTKCCRTHHPFGWIKYLHIHLILGQPLRTGMVVFAHGDPVYDTLNNDYCPIYNKPEINGSQAHQVTWDPKNIHQGYCKKHCQRYHWSHNQACSEVPK